MVGQDWAKMLDWDLVDVRVHLRISPPPDYQPIHGPETPPSPFEALRAVMSKDADTP